MADNVTLNPGTGGAVAASDDISGVQYQRVKLTLGADGVNDGDVSTSNPIPTGFKSDTAQILSTTTPLTAGASYTSSTIDGSLYPYTHVWCYSDQKGTLVFQESTDNVTFRTSQTYDVRAASARTIHNTMSARYGRYKFTCGATAQSTFELQISPKQAGYHDLQMVTIQKGCGFQDTTTDVLAGSATYTTPSADTSNQGQLFTFYTKSDVAGTVYIDESHDATTWENHDSFAVLANTLTEGQHSANGRYVRARYVNGASPQTSFVFQALCRTLSVVSVVRIDDTQNTVVAQQSATFNVKGEASQNTAPPSSATGITALPAVASANWPGYSEGNLVLLTTDLEGNLRVRQDNRVSPSLSNVGQSATSVQIVASNSARHGCIIHNDSTDTLYVKFGTTASTTSYTYKISADSTLEILSDYGYTGQIDGIWSASGSGNARVTDLSAN